MYVPLHGSQTYPPQAVIAGCHEREATNREVFADVGNNFFL